MPKSTLRQFPTLHRETLPTDAASSRSLPAPLPSFGKWRTKLVPAVRFPVPSTLQTLGDLVILDFASIFGSGSTDNRVIEIGRVSVLITANAGGGPSVSNLKLKLQDAQFIDQATGVFMIYDVWGTNIQGQGTPVNNKSALAYDWPIEPLRSDDFSDVNNNLGLKTARLMAEANLFAGASGPVVFMMQASIKYNVSQVS